MEDSSRIDPLTRSFLADYPKVSPRFAMLNVVRRCNAGCAYCADWKNDPDPRTDPDGQLVRRTLDGLATLGVMAVMFTGGEPMLRKDLFDLMAYARSLGLIVAIITNGTVVTIERARQLCTLEPAMVGISIDSLDAGRMSTIRGLAAHRVLRAVDIFADLRREEFPGLPISLQVTITRANIDDLVALATYAAERDLAISFQPVSSAGSGMVDTVANDLWPDADEIGRLEANIEELEGMRAAGCRISNRPEFLAQIPHFFRRRTFYPGDACTVAYTDVVIDTEFGVRPCWPMEPVAYLSDTVRIEDVWFSESMREARRTIRLKQCPGCLYACHLDKRHTQLPPLPN